MLSNTIFATENKHLFNDTANEKREQWSIFRFTASDYHLSIFKLYFLQRRKMLFKISLPSSFPATIFQVSLYLTIIKLVSKYLLYNSL